MDRLLAMHVFVRVVETGSFSKAAAEFAITQPTVTKMVTATEARLKVRLLNRNTRGVSVTEPGAMFFEKCKSIVREADEAENVARLSQTQAQGTLRISTSVAFGRRVIVPLALEFMDKHPGVQLDLNFEDRYSDLVAQGIDMAVRMGKLADSSLGAQFLGVNPWAIVGAPKYLRKRGTPLTTDDLAAHAAVIYSSVQGDEIWRLTGPHGKTATVAVKGRLRSNNLSAVLAATRNGLGLAAVPRYVATDSLAGGQLVEVLKDHTLAEQEIHAVFPSPKLVPGKVLAFISFLQGKFGPSWWQSLPKA